MFRLKLAGLRRRLSPWEIPAAMRALREERTIRLKAMRERREVERFADRIARRLMIADGRPRDGPG